MLKVSQFVPAASTFLVAAASSTAAIGHGGLDRAAWNVSLILVGLGALLIGFDSGSRINSAPLGVLRWTLFILPVYAVFQALPLPFRWTALSINPAASWEHALRFICYGLAFFTARAAVARSNDSLWLFTVPVTLVGGFEALLTLTQESNLAALNVPHGTYRSRNHVAGLLEMIFPFMVMYAAARLARAKDKGFSVWEALKFCFAVAIALAVVTAQLRTLSRMGLISLVAAAMIMALLWVPRWHAKNRRRGAMLIAAALAAITALIFMLPPQLVERLASLSVGDFSAGERLRIWRESLALIRDYPVFGCGLGGFETAFARYKDPNLSVADYAHNDYLQYLIELGPLVWSLALFSAGLIVVRVIRYASRPHRREKHFVAAAISASLVAILVHSFADYNLYIPANALVTAWVAGLATALGYRAGPNVTDKLQPVLSRKIKIHCLPSRPSTESA